MISIQDLKNPDGQVSAKIRESGIFSDIIDFIERFAPFNIFIKFCLVGGLGTLLNLFILFTSVEFFGIWYIHGAAFAFVIVITFNFTLNKIWTFRDKERKKFAVTRQYASYMLVGGIGMGINLVSLYALKEYFQMWYILAELFAILIVTIWNFQGARFLVFHKAEPHK